jgi:hypothetical protein
LPPHGTSLSAARSLRASTRVNSDRCCQKLKRFVRQRPLRRVHRLRYSTASVLSYRGHSIACRNPEDGVITGLGQKHQLGCLNNNSLRYFSSQPAVRRLLLIPGLVVVLFLHLVGQIALIAIDAIAPSGTPCPDPRNQASKAECSEPDPSDLNVPREPRSPPSFHSLPPGPAPTLTTTTPGTAKLLRCAPPDIIR